MAERLTEDELALVLASLDLWKHTIAEHLSGPGAEEHEEDQVVLLNIADSCTKLMEKLGVPLGSTMKYTLDAQGNITWIVDED